VIDATDGDDGTPSVNQPVMRPYHGTLGFIPLGRAVLASPMFLNRDAEDVFHIIDLYGQAQFFPTKMRAPGTNMVVDLERTQLVTSYRSLATRWDTSEKAVRTFLDRAVLDGLIRQEILFSDGARRLPDAPADATTGRSNMKVGQIITCLHYLGTAEPAQSDKSTEGT
jgi:hypothetical protein